MTVPLYSAAGVPLASKVVLVDDVGAVDPLHSVTVAELVAIAAMADATANPTISKVASYLMGFNGTTWDRLRTRGTGILQTEQAYSFLNIVAGQATTVVKASAGTLHAIVFNGPATATNVTNVYDHASGVGTIIATPLATAVVGPVTVVFDVAFANGLTIITGTANGANMTVVYR